MPPETYGGRHLVYTFPSTCSRTPLWSAPDGTIWDAMLPPLARVNTAFNQLVIQARHVFRAAFAQPIIPCHYYAADPAVRRAVAGLYRAWPRCTPRTAAEESAVRAGNRAAAALLERESPSAVPSFRASV